MSQVLKVVYRNNTSALNLTFELPEKTEVELLIQAPKVVEPPISNLEAKRQFLKSLIERMQQNPIPMNAPRFMREMLYERR
jgi:hypothetical protein